MHQVTLTLFLTVGLLICVQGLGSDTFDQSEEDFVNKRRVFMGGAGGNGNAQGQFGDFSHGVVSGGNGGSGGSATGGNMGGNIPDEQFQDQTGNNVDDGNNFQKRQMGMGGPNNAMGGGIGGPMNTMGGGIGGPNNAMGGGVGGPAADGNMGGPMNNGQMQGTIGNSMAGGNGFGKRQFDNEDPSISIGGAGGNGNAQGQFGANSQGTISGGNGGNGGDVGGTGGGNVGNNRFRNDRVRFNRNRGNFVNSQRNTVLN